MLFRRNQNNPMSKIEFNTEDQEITVTRGIGKTGDGAITINREGGGAIEINIGIASIGVTTDYGGAISLGIAGQEVTWGREGGTIHIGIGGFAVDVEARDCIVTETKSIFGQIVAQRSYPDPGCKLPDPPKPPPQPQGEVPPEGLEIPDGPEMIYMVLDGQKQGYYYNSWNNGFNQQTDTSILTAKTETRIINSPVMKLSDLSFTSIEAGSRTFVNTYGNTSTISYSYIKDSNQSLPGLAVTLSGYNVRNQLLTQERQGEIISTKIIRINTVDGIASTTSMAIDSAGAWLLYGSASNCRAISF